MIILESEEQLQQLVENEDVIAIFYADWCKDCTSIEMELNMIAVDYPEFTFVRIDRDKFSHLCEKYDVFGIPSFIAFKNGTEVDRFVSKEYKSKEEIEQFLDVLPD